MLGFYQGAIFEVGYHHEGFSNVWKVVVSTIKACSEKSDAERYQRSVNRLDRFQRDSLVSADKPRRLQNEFIISKDVRGSVNRDKKLNHDPFNKA
jgi:hypothetical protein